MLHNLKLQDEIIFPAREFDMDKVKTTLKQFVRDWSSEGEQERKSCYQPVIDKICQLFPTYQKYFEFTKDRPHIMFLFYNFSIECSILYCYRDDARSVQILVPGAGLGRLAWEFAQRGYTCQGNEFSLFMLFASHFVLN